MENQDCFFAGPGDPDATQASLPASEPSSRSGTPLERRETELAANKPETVSLHVTIHALIEK